MGWTATLFSLMLGLLIGHVGPRIPTLFLTRTRGFNTHFEPHPEAVNLSPYVTQRVLHLRMFYLTSFALAIPLLTLGGMSLKYGSGWFGIGLWLSTGWMVLTRLQSLVAGRNPPWSKSLAYDLQRVMNQASSTKQCCSYTIPIWRGNGIYCKVCGHLYASIARPDLGRVRSDGRIMGTLRLLMTDGYPMMEAASDIIKNEEE